METLFSNTVQAILGYFITNPNQPVYLRELAAIMNADPGNLSRQIQPLVKMGLLQTNIKGRLKFFSLNTAHPLYSEISAIISKTSGIPEMLRNTLKSIRGIKTAFIYGSYANKTLDGQSDVDVMIIGEVSSMSLASLLQPIEKKIGREIHFRVMGESEYAQRIKKNDAFALSIERGKKIKLI